jgi:hypothetical protein
LGVELRITHAVTLAADVVGACAGFVMFGDLPVESFQERIDLAGIELFVTPLNPRLSPWGP